MAGVDARARRRRRRAPPRRSRRATPPAPACRRRARTARCRARPGRRRRARAAAMAAGSASMNRLTRTPSARASSISGCSRAPSRRQVPAVVGGGLLGAVGHEGALLRPGLAHQLHQVVERVALDVELGAAASPAAAPRARARRWRRMWRSSGRGWTVMPCAPASSASARQVDDARDRPAARWLRSSAILLTLTESAVPSARGSRPLLTRGFIARVRSRRASGLVPRA